MSKKTYVGVMSKLKWTKNGARVRIIIFLVVCGVILLVHNRSNTDTSSGLYTSAQHGFSVNFRGEPTVQNYTLILRHGDPDVTAPCTAYLRKYRDVIYQVMVCDFPSIYDASGTDENLKVVLDSAVNDPKTTKLLTSSFSQFLGYRSINGGIEVKSGGTAHYFYVKYFLKDRTLYSLETVDADEAELNSFINTFRLN